MIALKIESVLSLPFPNSLFRFPCAINTTFRKNHSHEMVLHRPVELALVCGKVTLRELPDRLNGGRALALIDDVLFRP
jgi:hypothetical protein